MKAGYGSSLEHLLCEAKRVDLLLRRQIILLRSAGRQSPWDEFRGLYISEEDMDGLLDSSFPSETISASASAEGGVAAQLTRVIQDLEAEIQRKKERALHAGVELRLEYLKEGFSLSPAETDILLIGLLPELQLKYETMYAYLQDDVTRKAPSVEMVLSLFSESIEDKLAAREAFLPGSRLLRNRLLSLYETHSSNSRCLSGKALGLERRVADYLLGSDEVDADLTSFVRVVQPQAKLTEILLPASAATQLQSLTHDGGCDGATLAVHLFGPYGAGKKTTAEAICAALGKRLLVADVGEMLAADSSPGTWLPLVSREAGLQKAYVCWDRFELLLNDDRNLQAWRHSILDEGRRCGGIAFLASQREWEPAGETGDLPFVKVELPLPPYEVRRRLWQIHLDGTVSGSADVDIDALANKFRLTPGQIRDAVLRARHLAISEGRRDEQLTASHLYQACRSQSGQTLSTLARKVQPRYTWADIVLPKDQMAQLREIVNYVKYRPVVFGEWNFEQKVSLGKGLNVLFAGPSGTGKTMAAEIMSSELGLDLYKIDLSTVVSKYIGETEKNLDRIFREAHDSNAILFFDEADAIFGKRSEVRDSHDRYANIEIAYLLQKMEEYDGIVILATNLRKNVDEAFARRMHFSVEFPFPEEDDRRRIWEGILPAEAPAAVDLDLAFMARQFKITGGNIRNIALGAAFLAADDGGVINTEHLIRATKREYQKIGRMCNETDFAPYFGLVKG
jgi:ATP-dependent 26S proteasome regulatory subunit